MSPQVKEKNIEHCAVVATSSGSLDDLTQLDPRIHILRLKIHLEGDTFLDGYDILPSDFYYWFKDNSGKKPTTSPPDVNEIGDLLVKLHKEGYTDVIISVLSSSLSQTIKNVEELAILAGEKIRVHIFDTGTVSIPEGCFALKAVELLNQGYNVRQTLIELERMRHRCILLGYVDTLKYLANSGRVSSWSSTLGNILNISQILQFENGVYSLKYKVHSMSKALDKCAQYVTEYIAKFALKNQKVIPYILYCGNDDLEQMFSTMLTEKIGAQPKSYLLSPIVGVHLGPDTVGIALIAEELDLGYRKD